MQLKGKTQRNVCIYKVKWGNKCNNTLSYIINIICEKRDNGLCGKNISFSLQDQISSWQKWIYTGRGLNQKNKNKNKKQKGKSAVMIFWAVVLSKDGEMTGQDTCCCCVTCHICFASRRLACRYILFSSQQGEKWSRPNADSFWWEYLWNCCIKSVSDKQSWVAACHPTTVPNCCAPGRSARLQY